VKFTLPVEVTGGPVYTAGLEDVEVLVGTDELVDVEVLVGTGKLVDVEVLVDTDELVDDVEVTLVEVVPRVVLLRVGDTLLDEDVDVGADGGVDVGADEDVDVGADEGTALYNSSRRPAPQYSLLFPGQRKLQSS
jgi:hypothetical protein